MDIQTDVATQGPLLLLIRGLPGSGKSYLAAELSRAFGQAHTAILDPDATDYTSDAYIELSARMETAGIDTKFHPYRFLRQQAYEAIEAGKIILWNQAFTNFNGLTKTIQNLQSYAEDHGLKLPVLLVEVSASRETVQKRVADRAALGGHDVSAEEFERFFGDYHSFAEYYPTVQVDGEGDVADSVKAVLSAINTLDKI